MKLKSLKLNRIIRLILPLLFFSFFTSCDPGKDYSCVIQNDSDYKVKIIAQLYSPWYLEGKDTIYNLPDTIVVNKKTSKTIYTDGGIGSVNEYENCDYVPYDTISMLVYLKDSVKIIPNIHNMNHWIFRVIKEGKGGGGICECRLILTNDILKEK